MICSHCKRSGHEVDYCFALTGYLDWWGERPCNDGKNGTVRSYAAQTGPGRIPTANAIEENDVGILGLNADQVQALLMLPNSQKNSTPEKMSDK